MHAKSFIFGIITGATALAAIYGVFEFVEERPATAPSPSRNAEVVADVAPQLAPEAAVSDRTISSEIRQTGEQSVDAPSQQRMDATPQTTRHGAQVKSSGGGSIEPHASVSNAETTMDKAATQGPQTPDEAKDSDWAYFTEQALQQYFAKHPGASQFDILAIDCRTTFCGIQATAPSESAWPIWQQVVYDITQQPWSQFGQTGTSLAKGDAGIAFSARLNRQPHQ